MPYRICKSFEVENGHMLSKHPDLCRFPHGHTRKIELVLEADELDENQMVCDFKVFKEAVHEYLQKFDHAMCVNTQDPHFEKLKCLYGHRIVAFENQDPTTEVLARAIFDELNARLVAYANNSAARYPIRPGIRAIKVRVWETSSSWAEYSQHSADE